MSVSSSDNPVETLQAILEDAASADWTHADPRIAKLHDVTPKSRFTDPDPVIYVWQPTEVSFDDFSADGDLQQENGTARALISTMTEGEVMDYQRDIIKIIGDYIRDNRSSTAWHEVKPESASDLRNEHMYQQTDAYIAAVTAVANRLESTGT